jgi:hypothetical protein
VLEGLEVDQTIIKGPYSTVSKKLINGQEVEGKDEEKKKSDKTEKKEES